MAVSSTIDSMDRDTVPAWLLEIEALTMGGWKLTGLPVVRIADNVIRHEETGRARGRAPSVTPHYRVERTVRIAEPRAAPVSRSPVRHHHFEQKTILASRTQGKGVAESRAGYCEAYGATDALIDGDARATREAAYTEGHASAEAERVCYITATNGDGYGARMAFWQKANDNAHFVGTHTVTVTTRGVEEAWDRLARNPTMPDLLRETIAKAKASADGKAVVEANDAGPVKRWVRLRTKSWPQELRDHVSWSTPHNSRVAYSVVGQFPHDMSQVGMKTCLDTLVADFTRRQIPCQAVIHEPTAKNSRRNWHFHLLYHAGPAEELDDGRWSFEREWVRNKWRTLEWVPLKRMPRADEVSSKDWIPTIKARWRDIVNARAEAEGIDTRFTNDTNKARGKAQAQTRYSPGRQALRKQGFLTPAELAQDAQTWSAWRERTATRFRGVIDPLVARHARLRQDVRAAAIAGNDSKIEGALAECQITLGEADRLVDQATRAAMLHAAITSGPDDVLAHYGAQKDALAIKRPTPAREAKLGFVTEVCDVAERHLLEIAPFVQRLARIRTESVATLKTICTSLDQHMRGLETQVSAMIVASEDNGAEHNGKDRIPRATDDVLHKGDVLHSGRRPPTAQLPPRASARDLERLYQAVATERVFLTQQGEQRVVPGTLLERFSLATVAMRDPAVQRRLGDIAAAQIEELAPVTEYLRQHPDHVVRYEHGWGLGDGAPIALRRIAGDWAHDPVFGAALERVGRVDAPVHQGRRDAQERERAQALAHASAQRRRHMTGWIASRRNDTVFEGIPVPASEHAGRSLPGAESPLSRGVRPRPPGPDLGL